MDKTNKWKINITQFVHLPVLRKHIPYEWLSKLTSADYMEWIKEIKTTLNVRGITDEKEISDLIWVEINEKEKIYQVVKKNLNQITILEVEKQELIRQRDELEAEKQELIRQYIF